MLVVGKQHRLSEYPGRGCQNGQTGEVSALLREALVDANPYTSGNIASCAELSASLESVDDCQWSPEELADLLCSLQAA